MPDYIPAGQRKGLLATFNGGFKLDSAGGGFYLNGIYHGSLVNGAASIVYYKNGTIKIGEWGRDFTMNSSIEGVRQNLKLLVDHGKVAANANSDVMSNWGATLGGGYYVWRSGIGITKDGRIVYVYGPALNAQDLGLLLQRAGAVEGMQMDINPAWMKFDYYQAKGKPSDPTPVPLLPTQQPSAVTVRLSYSGGGRCRASRKWRLAPRPTAGPSGRRWQWRGGSVLLGDAAKDGQGAGSGRWPRRDPAAMSHISVRPGSTSVKSPKKAAIFSLVRVPSPRVAPRQDSSSRPSSETGSRPSTWPGASWAWEITRQLPGAMASRRRRRHPAGPALSGTWCSTAPSSTATGRAKSIRPVASAAASTSAGRVRSPRMARVSGVASSALAWLITTASMSTYTVPAPAAARCATSCVLSAVGRPEPISRNCVTPAPTQYRTARPRNARFSLASNGSCGTAAAASTAAARSAVKLSLPPSQ